MKSFILSICFCLFTFSFVNAHKVEIDISGIRSSDGSILVMLTSKASDKPLYAKANACKGSVHFTLDNVPFSEFQISVFHDENNNCQLDMDDKNRPLEGFARKKYSPKSPISSSNASIGVTLSLYYPSWDNGANS